MARAKKNSIYKKEIKTINITEMVGQILEDAHEFDWEFHLDSDWTSKLQKKLEELNFYSYNYTSNYGVYWSGILTLEPFDRLENTIGREETILNEIKNHHFKMEHSSTEGIILRFCNPTSSPLYRFFNQHKEDGFGGNIPYSVNGLIHHIERFLKNELETNLTYYGEWIYEEYEEELA